MKVYFGYSKEKGILEREVDALDIHTKKYTIRIRTGGILMTRKTRPKKNLKEEIKINEHFDLT